ncbi:zinc-dependent alcohol dehydrogenase family protein [Nonomuraea wenchangensis]|uniref:Alcohol dehydrogenase n=1 Tax=Nonomuraea wenchangensis TaxID=568860 RepID=A0A1I0J129_9ACTN|nr:MULTISPECIES: zinc-dependent alcohol dehydrogenase family protein [Nonomuraea]MED7923069.1 zinc-dependent alcohol dehydrogenase family protein [Nonomuraea sp. LP-02]SEU03331.1 alcohol dehydrogenase [Nonomuraea wenchangensis]
MRAVAFDIFGGELDVRELPDPAPAPHGAVIRVLATGLCRSDWHGWQGHDPDITALPHVPGHEFAGVVEAVGSDVRGWRPGARVTAPFVCACGTCPSCAAGEQQVCERQTQPGFTHWGSFAEYVAIDHADVNLVAVPEDMAFVTAAGLGCRFATAFRAVAQVGEVRPGEWVAVHGCGGVGLSAVMIATAAGARVVAVDVSGDALHLAELAGATHFVNASAGDAAAQVRELTRGGAHVSLDALGSPQTCAASVESLRRRGRHVQVGLLPGGPTPVPMDRVIGQELRLLGSHGMAAHAYPRMLELIRAGVLHPDQLVTRTIGLADAGKALAAMGSVPGVTVITPRSPL